MFRDPVCGMMVDEKKTPHVLEIGGKKFHLCSSACKDELAKKPKKYGA